MSTPSDRREMMKRGYSNPEGMSTDSIVFRILDELSHPMSIKEINAHPAAYDLTEQTIRRSINRMMSQKIVQLAGNSGPTKLYARIGTDMRALNTSNPKVIPFAGTMVSVKEFLTLMTDQELDPFKSSLAKEVLDADMVAWIRKRFLFTVITAGDSGFDEQLQNTLANLTKVHQEMDRITSTIRAWIDSSIWYAQYRDLIAAQIREMMKEGEESAELYKLAYAYIQS